jgi:hypothetical protein
LYCSQKSPAAVPLPDGAGDGAADDAAADGAADGLGAGTDDGAALVAAGPEPPAAEAAEDAEDADAHPDASRAAAATHPAAARRPELRRDGMAAIMTPPRVAGKSPRRAPRGTAGARGYRVVNR